MNLDRERCTRLGSGQKEVWKAHLPHMQDREALVRNPWRSSVTVMKRSFEALSEDKQSMTRSDIRK